MRMGQLRFALRMMGKSPGFTLVAVLTLALGIGGNTAVFSVVNALLLRSLPLAEPDRLVSIARSNPQRGAARGSFSLAAYETIRDRNRSFFGITAFCSESFTLNGGGEPEQLVAVRVSPNFLDVLQTKPLLGRGFLPEEGEPGGKLVVLIGSRLWQRRFSSDPNIAGKPITLSSTVYTIIGVMPPQFPFPNTGIDVWATRLMAFSLFQPYQIQHGAGYLTAIARLKAGSSTQQAEAELAVLYRQYLQEHPANPDADPNGRFDVDSLQEILVTSIRPTLLVLSGAIGFVLLIACANVASLLLARATGRAKEIAMRAALGASRGTLIRQLLAESLSLAALGGAVGILLANWGLSWLVTSSADSLPGFRPIRLDLQVLAFTLGISLLTGVAFGLMPALQISRPDLNSILRDSGWGTTGGGSRHRVRSVLVAGQMALSIVLLIGAGLLIESFLRLQSVNPGFDPHHVLTMRLTLPPAKYSDDGRKSRFFRDVVGRLENLPGVASATAALNMPHAANLYAPVLAEGQPNVPLAQRPLAQWNSTTPAYFKTVGIPLVHGRDFTWADDEHAPKAVIVSDSMARRFWPGGNALGQHLTFGRDQLPGEIVGIVGDVKNQGLEADSIMVFYTPYPQRTWNGMTIAIRAKGDPRLLAKSAHEQLLAVDLDQPVTSIETLEDSLASTLTQRRQTMYLLAGFAAIALLLAVVGLYGVMAYSVAQRTTEIGIRQAIGAQRGDILRMVMGQGLRLGLVGIGVGVLAAIALTRLISGMLYRVSATDPLTFAGISILFLVVALAASFVPAFRATRVDPLEALRGAG
jgi:putative ABC transport system permease protein